MIIYVFVCVCNVCVKWNKNNCTYAEICVYIIYKMFDWYLLDL